LRTGRISSLVMMFISLKLYLIFLEVTTQHNTIKLKLQQTFLSSTEK